MEAAPRPAFYRLRPGQERAPLEPGKCYKVVQPSFHEAREGYARLLDAKGNTIGDFPNSFLEPCPEADRPAR